MRLTTQIFFIIVLSADLINKITRGETDILGYGELFLLALMVFVALGDKISKFVMGKDGLTIEQIIEKQATNATKDIKAIMQLGSGNNLNQIDNLLSRTTGQDRDVWSTMVIYRLTMRVLLRKLCSNSGMKLNDTTAFVSMIRFLTKKEKLPKVLRENIEYIRDHTFFFEWGTGTEPTTAQIKRSLKIAPEVLKQIEVIVSKEQKQQAEPEH